MATTVNCRGPGSCDQTPRISGTPAFSSSSPTCAERGGARRVGAGDDGIVSIQNALHANNRFETARAGVITGPLAERPFFFQIARANLSFQHDLGVCRVRQTRNVAANDLDRLPAP